MATSGLRQGVPRCKPAFSVRFGNGGGGPSSCPNRSDRSGVVSGLPRTPVAIEPAPTAASAAIQTNRSQGANHFPMPVAEVIGVDQQRIPGQGWHLPERREKEGSPIVGACGIRGAFVARPAGSPQNDPDLVSRLQRLRKGIPKGLVLEPLIGWLELTPNTTIPHLAHAGVRDAIESPTSAADRYADWLRKVPGCRQEFPANQSQSAKTWTGIGAGGSYLRTDAAIEPVDSARPSCARFPVAC